MNTECKYHHISRAGRVEILDTQCHTLLDARAAQEGNTPAERRNNQASAKILDFTWCHTQAQRGIPLLDARAAQEGNTPAGRRDNQAST